MQSGRQRGGFSKALVALLVLALLFAGCGGGDGSDGSSTGAAAAGGADQAAIEKAEEFGSEASGSAAKGPKAALRGYLDARASGESAKACSYVSKELSELYGRLARKGGCAAFVERTTERLSAAERAAPSEVEIESVRLEGDSGYVIYTDAEGAQQAKPIVREGGAWKVSSILVEAMQRVAKE